MVWARKDSADGSGAFVRSSRAGCWGSRCLCEVRGDLEAVTLQTSRFIPHSPHSHQVGDYSVLISFWFLGFWIEKLLDSWCDAVTWYCLWFRDGLNWSQFTCLLVDSRPLGMKTHVDCGLLKWFPTLVLSLQHDSENGTNWTAYSL